MKRFEHGGRWFAHLDCVDFSASLNPLGMPGTVRHALVEHLGDFERYPDPDCTSLARAIARNEDVPASWVLACAGATDAFARICAVLRSRRVLVCAPCYSGYEQAVGQAGGEVVYHDLDPAGDFEVGEDLAGALSKDTDALFLANPNNPTGRCVQRDVLLLVLERAKRMGTLVVLDECFVDFTMQRGSRELVGAYPNLVLVKAFTKTYALAGIRLGYALCSDAALLGGMRAAGQPWIVSGPAQVAGVACLKEEGYLERSRRLVAKERTRLARALQRMGFRVIFGEANYLLFQAYAGLVDDLLHQGILVRSCANYKGLDETWCRIAVRTPAENDLLLSCLKRIV